MENWQISSKVTSKSFFLLQILGCKMIFELRLEALLIVVDRNTSLTLTGICCLFDCHWLKYLVVERILLWCEGSGEIIESEDGLMAIGSGGPFALAAARGQSLETRTQTHDHTLSQYYP